MKKFRFTLEPVLDLRRRTEEEMQQVLGEKQRALQAAQDELSRLNAEFKRYAAVLRDDHRSLDSDELRAHYAHLEYLDRRIIMQHALILQCRTEMERARADLIEASKERKVIEKLKDKRFEEHRVLEAVTEQKELDDANNRRAVRG